MDSDLTFFGLVLIVVGVSSWIRWLGMLIAGHQYISIQILDKLSPDPDEKDKNVKKTKLDPEEDLNYEPSKLDQFQWGLGLILILIGLTLLPW